MLQWAVMILVCLAYMFLIEISPEFMLPTHSEEPKEGRRVPTSKS